MPSKSTTKGNDYVPPVYDYNQYPNNVQHSGHLTQQQQKHQNKTHKNGSKKKLKPVRHPSQQKGKKPTPKPSVHQDPIKLLENEVADMIPSLGSGLHKGKEPLPSQWTKELEGILGHSQTIKYLQNMMVDDKDQTPTLNMVEKTSDYLRHIEERNAQQTIAPDDTHEISKLKTGEDAVSFFSRAGKDTAVKVVYLNRAFVEDPSDYCPYDLVVCDREDTNPEYFTMSSSGVIHVQPGQPTEFMSLSDWMRETTLFAVLRRIRFFKYYLVFKSFKIWYKNARFQTYCKKRAQLSSKLFMAKRTFARTLIDIKHQIHKLQSFPIMDFTEKKTQGDNTYNIEEFHSMQKAKRNDATTEFENQISFIQQKLMKLCKDVTSRARVDEMSHADNIEAFLRKGSDVLPEEERKASSKKSKSMVQQQRERIELKKALQKARKEADMLGSFIRLCDYMSAEALVLLAKQTLRQFYVSMVSFRSIVFKITIDFADVKEIAYSPNKDAIMNMFESNKEEIVDTVSKVDRFIFVNAFKVYLMDESEKNQQKRAHLLLSKSDTNHDWIQIDHMRIQDTLAKDKIFTTTQESIRALLNKRFARALDYGKNFENLKNWHAFGREWDSEDYASRDHSVKEFNEDLEKVKQALTDLKRMTLTEDIGILVVESRNLKKTLEPMMLEIQDEIKVNINRTSRDMCQNLLADFKDRVKSLKEKPTKLREFALFVHNLINVKDESNSLMNHADEVEKMYDLAHKNKVHVSNTDLVRLEELKEERDNFIMQIHDADTFKEDNILAQTRELEENIQKINTELFNTMAMLRTGLFVSSEADTEDVIHSLNKLEENINSMKQRTEKFSEYKRLFNAKPQEWTNLREVETLFKLRKEIWTTLARFQTLTEEWKNTEIEKIDGEEIEKTVNEIYVTAHHLFKKSQDQVAEHLKEKVKKWKGRLPVITMIGNKDLKQYHWQKIFKGMGVVLSVTSSYSLKHLADLGIYDQQELVTEVSNMATGEADLQKMIAQIDRSWKTLDFTVKPYRDRKDAFVLGSVEDIVQQLEDNMVTLQTMQASPYISGVKGKVQQWEKKLKTLQEILEEWLTCQKKWMYLEFIFSSDDITRQLHEEAAKFSAVDDDFTSIMRKTNQNKNVISVVHDPSLLESFQSCNAILDDIQKNLEDFLATKREAFPRLFFLSNDELIEILSQTREPRAVQPHLTKCFDSIKYLEFRDDVSSEVIGVLSDGKEPEHVAFSESIFATGTVESWLNAIDEVMKSTLYDLLKTTLKTSGELDREQWLTDDFPAQCIITSDMINWTNNVERALMDIETGANRDSLKQYKEELDTIINHLVDLVQKSDISANQRTLFNTLLVLHVHNVDVVKQLIDDLCDNALDFGWQMQLRTYWDTEVDDCYVQQANASFQYGYEYIGNQSRLVVTPLTERCYMTLTGALHLRLGGNPVGPAGTGKTETVKDLSKALARHNVTFNCSEGLGVPTLRQMFTGLAQAGSWACFDEFNRIDVEVLSVVAQYMKVIQQALFQEEEHFIFDGKDMKLNANYGVFITMNPGYIGRTELPDNLKSFFRPVSMMIPDYKRIAEIMLYAEGFKSARSLAQKMTQLFRLCSEQLSKQHHYDFGMRAVKSILIRAGNLKRNSPSTSEETILIRAIVDSNKPKFLKNDTKLFMALVNDLFPGVEIQPESASVLNQVLEHYMEQNELQLVPSQINTIMQLYKTMNIRHGTIIVGEAGSGKTTAHKALRSVLSRLGESGYDQGKFQKVVGHVLNPKAVQMEELYGAVHEMTKEWQDGIVAHLSRIAVRDKSASVHWFVFDGPVDSLWIENMNTVLDDSKMLCLTNGERIKLPASVRLLFEVHDLSVASPATVSRCGVVYCDEEDMGSYNSPLQSWLKKKPLPKRFKHRLRKLISSFVPKTLSFLHDQTSEFVSSSDLNLIQSLTRLLDVFLTPEHGFDIETGTYTFPEEVKKSKSTLSLEDLEEEDKEDEKEEKDSASARSSKSKEQENEPREEEGEAGQKTPQRWGTIDVDLDRILDNYFVFSVVWSLGANVTDSDRQKFDSFFRGLISDEIKGFPSDGSVYDYFVDIATQSFEDWKEKVKPYEYDPQQPFWNILVPTAESTRTQYIMQNLVENGNLVLLTGESGVGKTVLIQELLRDSFNAEDVSGSYSAVNINLSAQTTSSNIRDILNEKLDHKRKNIIGSSTENHEKIIFIDNANMPALDEYGSQPPLELVRQIIGGVGTRKGFYDTKKMIFKYIEDSTFILACAPSGGGRKELSPRLVRHFHLLNIPNLRDSDMKTIYNSILSGFLEKNGFPEDITNQADNVVSSTLNIYREVIKNLLPRPKTQHYTFNLRDVSGLFQGIMQIKSDNLEDKDELVHLWMHEASRVFRDRLVNDEDRSWFDQHMNSCAKTYFDTRLTDSSVIFGDFVREQDERSYKRLTHNTSELGDLFADFLEDYKIEKNMNNLNLVFFEDAVHHLSRLCRILRQPRGSALLMGVAGTGRRTLTRLASFIQGYSTVEIEVNKNFKYQQFLDHIKEMLMKAGCDDQQLVFLMSDTQIVDERILEIVHNLLNSGEVPNLFKVEDYEQIIRAVKPKISSMDTTRDMIFQHFIHLIRENLHIVLCMSPVSSSFRERIRMFPSLVNNMTIDWYDTWPDDALFSVAHHMFENVPSLSDHIESICRVSVYISTTVSDYSKRFSEEMKRKAFTTPSNYLQLLSIYGDMLKDQKIYITQQIQKYKKGITKLEDTNDQVQQMKKELKKKQPLLEQSVKETSKIEQDLVEDKNRADEVRAVCVKEERECQEAMEQTQLIKESCQKDLDKAMPAFRAAQKALQTINRDDIYEIKSFSSPPPLVQTIMEAVCILFAKKPNWENSQQLLTDSKFLHRLETFDKENISDKTLKKLQQYINMPDFDPEKVANVNRASKSLCMWVIAMDGFAKILKKIEPKKKKLSKAETDLNEAEKKLEVKRKNLKEIEENVEKLQHDYEKAIQRKKDLNSEIQQTEERLDRAEKLLDLLGSERVRWGRKVDQLQVDFDNLVGDILLSSACIAYLGPFTQKYRANMMTAWINKCTELRIPVSKKYSLLNIVEETVLRDWKQKGLPTDDVSKQNAVLSQKCKTWPLFIDPQGEANNWIRNTEKSSGLKVIKDGDPDMMKTLEASIRVGIPCLLEDVPDKDLNPALEPLLLKQTFKQGGRTLIRLNDQDVDYNKNFKFYMTTKLSNPYYPPEIQIKVSLINFTVTMKGLEDQLLGDVVAHEKSDLEKKKNTLLSQITHAKNQLKELEDRILELLFKESEVHLLDDLDLINALKESKIMAETIERSLVQAEKTADQINETRELYRPVATRASVLYFVIADLSIVDPMYQYSLSFFKSIFKRCLEQSDEDSDFEKRLENLINFTTDTCYHTICRGLFQKDRLLFSFMMTVEILRNSGAILEEEWNFFLRGSQVSSKSPILDISNAVFSQCVGLSKAVSTFSSLPEHIKKNPNDWKALAKSDKPYDEKLPEPFETELSQWRKMLLLKAFHPNEFIFGIKKIVRLYLGQKFVESPQTNLFEVFKDSNCQTPIIFVLNRGADPQSLFEKFMKERDYEGKVLSLSLGQGQGEKAESLISRGAESGEWVYLQNCHLAASWMPRLENVVKRLQARQDIHQDFRLFLTSTPSKFFPVTVLQNSLKLTTEPPNGLKENLKQSVNNLSIDTFEKPNVHKGWKQLLFSLLFFHAILQERQNFGSLGWNTKYDWNSSDLETSLQSLELFVPTKKAMSDGEIPWEALQYIIAVIHYGGRVTDFLDLRCTKTIFTDLFSKKIFKESFHYGDEETKEYYPPSRSTSLDDLKAYIDTLPEYENPRIFGLNENASITFFQQQSQRLLNSITEIEPAVVSNSSSLKSSSEVVLTLIKEFEEKLPQDIETENSHKDMFRKVDGDVIHSLGTFLLQEVSSFNNLVQRIRKSLQELKKAIGGIIVMSDDLEAMYNAFLYQQVPDIWSNIAYPSQLRLSQWFYDLCDRVRMINGWIENGQPTTHSYWLGGFFFPQAFLTSVLQTYARKHKIPIDDLTFKTIPLSPNQMVETPEDGVVVQGLFLEGASWDKSHRHIRDSKKGELYASMPPLHLVPIRKRMLKVERQGKKHFDCPMYRTAERAGRLSTTGVSMNYVTSLKLNPGHKAPSYWIKKSVALLCAKPNK